MQFDVSRYKNNYMFKYFMLNVFFFFFLMYYYYVNNIIMILNTFIIFQICRNSIINPSYKYTRILVPFIYIYTRSVNNTLYVLTTFFYLFIELHILPSIFWRNIFIINLLSETKKIVPIFLDWKSIILFIHFIILL